LRIHLPNDLFFMHDSTDDSLVMPTFFAVLLETL